MAGRTQMQSRARATLDDRFSAWRQLPAKGARPHGGWIRAIRDAIGMTAEDLAARLGISQPSLTRLEKSERNGSIRLETLTRVADALECDVVYALVPRRPLGEMVTEQARRRAIEQVGRVAHTMALEDQAVDDSKMVWKVDVLADHYLTTPGLWRISESESSPARA
jgi:predicted DNA-binding mobile mystery protein A